MSDEDFRKYVESDAPKAWATLERTFRERTPLTCFESYIFRIMWAMETGRVSFPDTPEGSIAKDIISKMTSDANAMVACMLRHATLGAYHQARSLIELTAQTYYLFADDKKRAKRVEKWTSWQAMVRYTIRRNLELQVAANEIAEEDAFQGLVPMNATDVAPEVVARWRKLWDYKTNVELTKAPPSWMHPASYASIIREMEASKEPDVVTEREYNTYCNATHLSPASRYLHMPFDHMVEQYAFLMCNGIRLFEKILELLPKPADELWPLMANERVELLKYAIATSPQYAQD